MQLTGRCTPCELSVLQKFTSNFYSDMKWHFLLIIFQNMHWDQYICIKVILGHILVFVLQVRVVKIKLALRSTSPLLPVDVHPLHHLRHLLRQLALFQAVQWPLRLPDSRCPPCSRCSRSRTASRQSRSRRAWTQWASCRRESTGSYHPFHTGSIRQYCMETHV